MATWLDCLSTDDVVRGDIHNSPYSVGLGDIRTMAERGLWREDVEPHIAEAGAVEAVEAVALFGANPSYIAGLREGVRQYLPRRTPDPLVWRLIEIAADTSITPDEGVAKMVAVAAGKPELLAEAELQLIRKEQQYDAGRRDTWHGEQRDFRAYETEYLYPLQTGEQLGVAQLKLLPKRGPAGAGGGQRQAGIISKPGKHKRTITLADDAWLRLVRLARSQSRAVGDVIEQLV